MDTWAAEHPDGNVALRVPKGVVGVDVDQYDEKRGADALDELGLDPLPPTWISTSRPYPSGIRWFRTPGDVRLKGAPVSGVEIVQHHHRYAIVPPSIHRDTGLPYRWVTPDGEPSDTPPRPEDLPELPPEWVEAFRDHAEPAERRDPVPPRPAPARPPVDRSGAVQRILDEHRDWSPGGRHDTALKASMALARLEHSGHPGATEAIDIIGAEFLAAKPEAEGREWVDLVSSARTTAASTVATRPDYADLHRPLLDTPRRRAAHLHQTADTEEPTPDATGDDDLLAKHMFLGGSAILDTPDEIPAIWGRGSEVLWAAGEPCMIAAPPGVGKTTLAQQVVLSLCGLRPNVLGLPTRPAEGKVLYLAMDRPDQILRSFRRMVTETDRATLNERLVIRKGPIPADLAKPISADPAKPIQADPAKPIQATPSPPESWRPRAAQRAAGG
ncbi:MAG: AAA family ATPase, partial [Acidimicrobiia bacterium]|nr:AAA family ATPase [Acidimicrobiia bacterium]